MEAEREKTDVSNILKTILKEECVYTVFQPIVNLVKGTILGYEALSRFEALTPDVSVEEVFQAADEMNVSWELERLCRKKALKTAGKRQLQKKLFLNVDPTIINDSEFKNGFTKEKLEKYKLNPSMIVFEITERKAFSDYPTFKKSMDHYRNQNFKIAIDDFGSGYSSISLVCETLPEYIKIDRSIIHNIHNEKAKKNMIQNLIKFSKDNNIRFIAEGIEDERELRCLIDLGIEYGQGFLLGRGIPAFGNILPEATRVIKEIQNHEYSKINASFHDCKTTTEGRKINSLSKKGMTVLSNTLAVDVLHLTHSNPDVLGVTIIDTQNRVEGYISSRKLTEIFGGKYGYSLNQNKLIKDVMETDFLCVSENLSVEETSRLTMSRNEDTLYDPVVLIRNNGFYAGIVIIKDLLESLIEIEVKQRTTEIKKINSNLSVAMEELKKNSIRAEKDLSMATQVQKNMYPHTAPQTTEWDCSFYFKPMSSVSGDVYDFYLSENHLDGVCLFDVSGHGISSALVGILAKSLASRIFIKNANQPLDKIITEINTRFIEEKGDAENYLTGVLIRMKENYIEYVNAGHPDVLLRKKDSTNKHNAAAITDTNGGDSFKGRFLGIPDLPTSYETLSIPVAHDDSILIYSDCLIESCNTKGEQFGISRLTSVFENSSATLSKDILEDIIKYFSSYTKGKMVSDDLTILICRRK